jgi:hypothetical protein
MRSGVSEADNTLYLLNVARMYHSFLSVSPIKTLSPFFLHVNENFVNFNRLKTHWTVHLLFIKNKISSTDSRQRVGWEEPFPFLERSTKSVCFYLVAVTDGLSLPHTRIPSSQDIIFGTQRKRISSFQNPPFSHTSNPTSSFGHLSTICQPYPRSLLATLWPTQRFHYHWSVWFLARCFVSLYLVPWIVQVDVRVMTNLTRHFVCVVSFVERLRHNGMMHRFWRLEYGKLEGFLDLFLIDWDLCW